MKLKLEEYITELAMKSDTDIDLGHKKGDYFNAKITLGSGDIWYFNATNDMGDGDWSIVFYAPSMSPGIRGDKNKVALETFAAVEKLVKDFIDKEKPERFHFTGTGTSRVKLYNTLAKKILKSGKYEKGPDMKMLQGAAWIFVKK